VPGKPLGIKRRVIRVEVIEKEKRIEERDLVIPESPFQMDTGSLYGGHALHYLFDSSGFIHNSHLTPFAGLFGNARRAEYL
jgi:hypothetical protein